MEAVAPNPFPFLATERLRLRAFRPDDAGAIQRLASVKEVAAGTLTLPHPYPDGAAPQWIADQQREYDAGRAVHFAVTLASDGTLIGAIGLDFVADHRHARLGYWLGHPYWGCGYATEAVKAVIAYGFAQRQVHRIYAGHFLHNPASGRVLQKAGFSYEGRLRHHYWRFGEYVDVALYGLVNDEFGPR